MNSPNNENASYHTPDLHNESERMQHGPKIFKTYFDIAEAWDLTHKETMDLLELENVADIEQLKRYPQPQLFTEKRLFKITHLMEIYKGLQICHERGLANQWIKIHNRNQIFEGSTPLEFMIRGDLNAVLLVRRLIEARSHGNY